MIVGTWCPLKGRMCSAFFGVGAFITRVAWSTVFEHVTHTGWLLVRFPLVPVCQIHTSKLLLRRPCFAIVIPQPHSTGWWAKRGIGWAKRGIDKHVSSDFLAPPRETFIAAVCFIICLGSECPKFRVKCSNHEIHQKSAPIDRGMSRESFLNIQVSPLESGCLLPLGQRKLRGVNCNIFRPSQPDLTVFRLSRAWPHAWIPWNWRAKRTGCSRWEFSSTS